AKGKWVVPGLVDAHVHFFQSGNLYTRPDVADFNAVVPYLDEVARNKARLPATFKVWLASGVTSVVDIGGPYWNFEMRRAARRRRRTARFDDRRSAARPDRSADHQGNDAGGGACAGAARARLQARLHQGLVYPPAGRRSRGAGSDRESGG